MSDTVQGHAAPPANRHTIIEQEVGMLLTMQYVSPTKPLVFVMDPALGGDFAWPDIMTMLEPNNGLYRLSEHRNNSIFHFVEDHLFQLLDLVQRQHADNQGATVAKLHQALATITHAKCVEWKQQRSDCGIGPLFVNTGKAC